MSTFQRYSAVPRAQEVRYWMRTPAVTVTHTAPLSDALLLMQQHRVRRLPVIDDDGTLRGIITTGDIRGADVLAADGIALDTIAAALRRITVQQVMTTDPVAMTPDTGLREAAQLMIENKIGGVPVVDHDGAVVGIVTESDLFEALVQQLDQQDAAAER